MIAIATVIFSEPLALQAKRRSMTRTEKLCFLWVHLNLASHMRAYGVECLDFGFYTILPNQPDAPDDFSFPEKPAVLPSPGDGNLERLTNSQIFQSGDTLMGGTI
jgi:hypothetical protein